MREYMSAVTSQPVCGHLLLQPQETNTEGDGRGGGRLIKTWMLKSVVISGSP